MILYYFFFVFVIEKMITFNVLTTNFLLYPYILWNLLMRCHSFFIKVNAFNELLIVIYSLCSYLKEEREYIDKQLKERDDY